MQTPTPFGGVVFDRRSWKYYEKYNPRTNKITVQGDQKVKLIYKHMYIDSAMKTESRHDYSVIQLWGMGEDGRIYLLDQLRGKYEAPELKKRALEFFDKHEYHLHNNVMGVRSRKIEDKASGIGLIQEIQALRGRGYVEGIPRDRDKVSRAYTALPALDEGLVCLPSDAIFLPGYLEEFDRFTAEMTHRYDDQIDPTLDAIQDMILNSGKALDYSGFGK
jgi:predicted phage terminase large subunit-like protein